MDGKQVTGVISSYKDKEVLSILVDGKIEDLIVDEPETQYNVGDIIIGKVKDIAGNISSAFIDLGSETAYIPMKDRELKPGMELPVQITKEVSGNKEMAASIHLSLAGKHAVVLLPQGNKPSLHISKKIQDETERERLGSIIQSVVSNYDIMIRTKACGVSDEVILQEVATLSARLDDIISKSKSRTVFSKIYEADDVFISAIRDCRFGEVTKITTDLPEMHEKMRESFPDVMVELYQDEMLKLTKLHKIESTIESVFERKVWLKSGGYLVIERTEAMTVVDVNSGKNITKGTKDDTFLKTNLEAAEELARQLRIRNISGMILVDFINMRSKDNYEILGERLREALLYDPCNACFIDFTRLGLAEITRQKKRRETCTIIDT